MLFTSITFLYYFLPILLITYYLSGKSFKNYILLTFSLFFYAWGEPKLVFLMILMVIFNYYIGLKIDSNKNKTNRISKYYLILGIFLNLLVLGYFKYAMFIVDNINALFNLSLVINEIKLPIGISFFTFQAMSYIIDVYRNDGKVQEKLSNLMLYVALFPQLIAGPIVRYSTVDEQIRDRSETTELFSDGINRFIIGLGKKVLLSNNMAIVADMAFNTVGKGETISTSFAWIGISCYALQIYFDFSGYSDMAIGLGKMFGFEFLENFNYPYISQSISEFWRRWHISLGSWFRDYVYIPLGGNRRSPTRNIFNLSVVWFLTGLWHGASWTFILWGCYFGAFIILERNILKIGKNEDISLKSLIRIPITFILVLLGWVLFRAETLSIAIEYYKTMFLINESTLLFDTNTEFFIFEYLPIFIIALIGATPIPKLVINKIFINKDNNSLYFACEIILLTFVMYISTAHLIASDFNPFIYFNF